MKLTDFPKAIEQWNWEKNIGLDPVTLTHATAKKVWWKCTECQHEWEAIIANRTKRNAGCPACAKVKQKKVLAHARTLVQNRPGSKPKITTEVFVERSRKVHEDKFDYTLTEYKRSAGKVKITCPIHGVFEQVAADHLRGRGCNGCREDHPRNFLDKARDRHGDKYDYSKVRYVDGHKTVVIVCPIHGDFEQTPVNHVQYGCQKCGMEQAADSNRWTTEQFVEKARELHGDLYDYSLVDYKSSNEEVNLVCRVHGLFSMRPANHISQSQGCRKCAYIKQAERQSLTTDQFIERAKEVHKDKYDYSLVDYKNNNEKVQIICPVHGVFSQKANGHLNGKGCNECNPYKKGDQEWFLQRARDVHGHKYSYKKTVYVNATTPIVVTCPKHGDFQTTPHWHLNSKSGCQTCRESHGEKKIRVYLENRQMKFRSQWRFDSDPVRKMKFDFVVVFKGSVYVIEYQGRQHYTPHSFSSDKSEETMKKNLVTVVKRDKIKRKWCEGKKLKFLAIPYWEKDNIDQILDTFLSDELVVFENSPPQGVRKYVELVHKFLEVAA